MASESKDLAEYIENLRPAGRKEFGQSVVIPLDMAQRIVKALRKQKRMTGTEAAPAPSVTRGATPE